MRFATESTAQKAQREEANESDEAFVANAIWCVTMVVCRGVVCWCAGLLVRCAVALVSTESSGAVIDGVLAIVERISSEVKTKDIYKRSPKAKTSGRAMDFILKGLHFLGVHAMCIL